MAYSETPTPERYRMFTHNPTTTGRRKARVGFMQDSSDRYDDLMPTRKTVQARTTTEHRYEERPYVYGRSSMRARNAIQAAYRMWLSQNAHPQQ